VLRVIEIKVVVMVVVEEGTYTQAHTQEEEDV